jgi:hypothetical protein
MTETIRFKLLDTFNWVLKQKTITKGDYLYMWGLLETDLLTNDMKIGEYDNWYLDLIKR